MLEEQGENIEHAMRLYARSLDLRRALFGEAHGKTLPPIDETMWANSAYANCISERESASACSA